MFLKLTHNCDVLDMRELEMTRVRSCSTSSRPSHRLLTSSFYDAVEVIGAEARDHQYFVTSGLLQGCSLSGSLFANSADGFLRWLRAFVDAHDWRCQGGCR